MATDRITFLKNQRENLIDQWKTESLSARAKILVRIMDLEEDIDMALKDDKNKNLRIIH